MKSLVDWLHRLAAVAPDVNLAIGYFRVAVPGFNPLDVENWLLSIDPQGLLAYDFRAAGPESWSIIRVPDLPQKEANVHERHRLGADIACFLSLALERRVVVPNDFAVHIPQLEQVNFLPVGQIVDQCILGPLPTNAKPRLNTYLSAVAGLSLEDQEFIGAASSAYHGALLLFDREPRAAYTLLVTGIEVLSRRYGSPPTGWTNWEESRDWDAVFTQQGLTNEQASTIRDRLMNNRQLRLGATFRNYASSRIGDDFWDKPLDQWIYGFDANNGTWEPPIKVKSYRISDVLSFDRNLLRQSLGQTYALRSSVVHEADWVELMKLAPPPVSPLNSDRPLPFPILRAILADLIWLEISSHSTPAPLPDFQLLREQPKTT
jgi:hypothetical protein